MTSGDLSARVGALSGALAAVQAALEPAEAWRCTDEQVLTACREVSALRARTESAYLLLVAEVDRRRAASGRPTGTGAGTSFGSTTEGLLRSAALVTAGQARRDVAAAHALHGLRTDPGRTVPPVLPLLAEQLRDGTVTREHVDVAVRCLDRVPAHLTGHGDDVAGSAAAGRTEVFGTSVRDVVVTFVSEVAGSGTARDLDRACRQVLAAVDPDGRDRFDPLAHERRFLDMSTDDTGMLLGRFQLDAAAGLALRVAVDAHSAPAPTGDGVRDPRSARQRRADALLQVAETARSAAVPVRGEPPRVVVHVTPEQVAGLVGRQVPGQLPSDEQEQAARAPVWGQQVVEEQVVEERVVEERVSDGQTAHGPAPGRRAGWQAWSGAAWTEGGGAVGRATLRRLACDAVLQRVVRGAAGETLALGREVRLATRSQRRALAARDRGCVVPGCGAPPEACDAHHVRHWADGGPTDTDNLALLCGTHHTAVHASTWAVVMAADGIPEVVPPRWVDPDQRPRRLWHHLVAAAATRAYEGAPGVASPPATVPRPGSVPPPVLVSTLASTDGPAPRRGLVLVPDVGRGPIEQTLVALLDTG